MYMHLLTAARAPNGRCTPEADGCAALPPHARGAPFRFGGAAGSDPGARCVFAAAPAPEPGRLISRLCPGSSGVEGGEGGAGLLGDVHGVLGGLLRVCVHLPTTTHSELLYLLLHP